MSFINICVCTGNGLSKVCKIKNCKCLCIYIFILDHTVCQTVHRIHKHTGQSLNVDKKCALPSSCEKNHVGCKDTDKYNEMVRFQSNFLEKFLLVLSDQLTLKVQSYKSQCLSSHTFKSNLTNAS